MSNRASPRHLRSRELRQQCLALREGGASYAQIGRQLGVNKTTAWKHVTAALAEIEERNRESAQHVLELSLLRLDHMLLGIYPRAVAGAVKEIDRVLRIEARRADLLGLKAPQRLEVETYEPQVRTEVVRALRRLPPEKLAQFRELTAEVERLVAEEREADGRVVE